ncbi:MAG: hypothetical protein RIQ56_136 [Candidatus Parcubacteria bacterium]|jgi:hypothetical protein
MPMALLRGLGRFVLAILNSKVVVIPVAVLVAVLAANYIWERRPFREAPPPPAMVADITRKDCLEVLAADDGATRLQQKFMAHAALNMADKTGLTVCEIHKTKRTLLPPSQDGSGAPRYPGAAKILDSLPIFGDEGRVAGAKIEVEKVLKDRKSDYTKYPCLQYVERYIRPPKWGTTQDVAKMDAEMDLLYADGESARFYGPKGTGIHKCR